MCEGYSRILQCVLDTVGIESNVIKGCTENKKDVLDHAWNQVKIDDKWYNVDITWDRANFLYDQMIKYCLINDKEFAPHFPIIGNYEECDYTFDKTEIEKLFVDNLLPMNKIKYILPRKKNMQSQEELKPWDLRNYSQEETITQNTSRNKTKEIDEEER